MTISTYTQLQTEVAAWSHRNDLTAKIPDFITLAENSILRMLELRINEASVTGTTTGDTITPPSGMARIERIEVVSGGTKYTLAYTPANGIERLTGALGLPSRFTLENGVIRLIRAPDSAYAYTVFYLPDFTALSATSPSNWVLLNAADVYLYGTLLQMALYTQDDVAAKKWSGLFEGVMSEVKRSDESRRMPLTGGLQIKPRQTR